MGRSEKTTLMALWTLIIDDAIEFISFVDHFPVI
jgi:hypothetical protein